MKAYLLLMIAVAGTLPALAKSPVKPPIMGWSSWNHFEVNINEDIMKAQADAMASNGMKDAGYSFINLDDGYFGGRDASGRLLHHTGRFPSGMKAVADYIHSKGLKAGIYSDVGYTPCGSYGANDSISHGCGLMGHEWDDLTLMLRDWGYDFIKVDWCGGFRLDVNDEQRYKYIIDVAREVNPDVVFNVCRWEFPGPWVVNEADSWRVSGDIQPNFDNICRIIDLNADLWTYCSPGHYNDMDMLQVGRGMTYDEDKAHFSMWCMMVSPLLAGNDLTAMSDQTLGILTNREMIAINQDPLFYQARRLRDDGDLELWAKPLGDTMSGDIAVALLNRSTQPQSMSFDLTEVGLVPSAGYTVRDVWAHKDLGKSEASTQKFEVAPHGVVVLRIKGKTEKFPIYHYKDRKPSFDEFLKQG